MKKNKNYQKIVHTFSPIFDENSKILILGSFPSIKSRENNFYYMNKQNRFWKILSLLFNIDFVSMNKEEKMIELKKLNIALYDVIYSCEIIGSNDSSIKNVIYSDINKIIKLSKIDKIFLNGQKAYKLFIKGFPDYKSNAILLPSTSPANAKMKINELLEKWKIIINCCKSN